MATSLPYDPIQTAFLSVIREFKKNVKDDDIYSKITQAKTIDDVYTATDELQAEQARLGHLRHLSKIDPYLTRLNDYAHAIEIFVQAKADVLALIWGPIVLLLQWANVLKTSFDAIVETTEEIGLALPEFKQAAVLIGENNGSTTNVNSSITDVLLLFFKDIVEFYSIALRFFRLPRWRYAFEVLWPKYRDKIKVVARNIERHTLLLRRDVQSKHILEEHEARVRALEHYDATDSAHRRQEYRGIMTDICPQHYDDKLHWVQSRVCEGTGKWLLRSPTFTDWLHGSDKSTRLLWLQGIPGAGKTFLSSTVIETTRTRGRTLFIFLAYTDASKTSALSVFHSLIFQLASQDETLQAVLCESSRENLKNSLDAAYKLFSDLLACAGPVYIVVDGLDEIGEAERCTLVKRLVALSEVSEELRVCLSSRPEVDLKRAMANQAISTLRVDAENAGSIQAFVNRWTHNWLQECRASDQASSQIQQWLAPLASKSKGMFLYAKVVLTSIEFIDNISEIESELRVLPESLDAAYERILSRVNNMQPNLRDKARKLLGWLACTPIPFTVQEIQRALTVKVADREGKTPLLVDLQIEKICGPIIEIVDEYVHFIHFTAKEYVSSPRIANCIDVSESIQSLTACCITYLCQEHHEPELLDEEISENVLDGRYVLHEYAATNWLELVEHSVKAVPGKMPSPDLIDLLKTLVEHQNNPEYGGMPENGLISPSLDILKTEHPELHSMLAKAIQFRQEYTGSQHKRQQGATWLNLDPLTISQMSVRIHEVIDTLLNCQPDHDARNQAHQSTCTLDQIQDLYGSRPFKCSFIGCAGRRLGFQTRRERDSHEKYHDRPWKCSVPTCQYAQGGFLSRKMRDEHLDRHHQEKRPNHSFQLEQPDSDEVQPLLFDLVQADDVDAVRELLPFWENKSNLTKQSLVKLAASLGSVALLHLLLTSGLGEVNYVLASCAARHRNAEMLEYILKRSYQNGPESGTCSMSMGAVLQSDSLEIYHVWKKYVCRELEWKHRTTGYRASRFFTPEHLQVATGRPDRQQIMVNLFEETGLLKALGRDYRGDALICVAQTNCSVEMAKCLLKGGYHPVDYRRSFNYMTALHHAARKNSVDAAKLMKFLLLCGANPEIKSNRSKASIRDEKGAKGISKYLGMSWDELVAETKKEREQVLRQKDLSPEEIIDQLALLV